MNNTLHNILHKSKEILQKIGHFFKRILHFFGKCVTFIKNHTWDEIKEFLHQFLLKLKERTKNFRAELHKKHRFVIIDNETLKEKRSIQLTGINIFVAVGTSVIVLIVLTSILIAYTSLREFIPGYTRPELVEQSYLNSQKADSLETELNLLEIQLENIKLVLAGNNIPSEEFYMKHTDTVQKVQPVEYTHSEADATLREEVESADQYQVKTTKTDKNTKKSAMVSPTIDNSPALIPFFSPLHGEIIAHYDKKNNHYGSDIAGAENSVIKSTYSGTVLLATFTPETGYIIVIQHPNNYISIYKHCNSLLKHVGDAVRAGEPIAFLGKSNSKKATHLHFEIWYNGKPINPETYVNF